MSVEEKLAKLTQRVKRLETDLADEIARGRARRDEAQRAAEVSAAEDADREREAAALRERAEEHPRVRITIPKAARTSRVDLPRRNESGHRESFVIDRVLGPVQRIELADDWERRLAADVELADLVEEGVLVVEPLTVDECVREERRGR